jgi:hypothetical protein
MPGYHIIVDIMTSSRCYLRDLFISDISTFLAQIEQDVPGRVSEKYVWFDGLTGSPLGLVDIVAV